MEWMSIDRQNKPLYEVGDSTPEVFDEYEKRYSGESTSQRIIDARRYIQECLSEAEGSLLVFGAGHSDHCNTYYGDCPDLRPITSVDIVPEAAHLLHPDIEFICWDILNDDIREEMISDYIISTHTLEHFTKEELFRTVWPKLTTLARKAVITVVPYGSCWGLEPSHRCRFYKDDEFAFLQNKCKTILDDQELVFWKDII